MLKPDIPAAEELYRCIDPDEAAAFLKTTPRTLELRRRDGTGPTYIRINQNVVKYRPIDLIAYLEQHIIPSDGDDRAAV